MGPENSRDHLDAVVLKHQGWHELSGAGDAVQELGQPGEVAAAHGAQRGEAGDAAGVEHGGAGRRVERELVQRAAEGVAQGCSIHRQGLG